MKINFRRHYILSSKKAYLPSLNALRVRHIRLIKQFLYSILYIHHVQSNECKFVGQNPSTICTIHIIYVLKKKKKLFGKDKVTIQYSMSKTNYCRTVIRP